ncbi:hypothetical protein ACOME3_003920 [Neoechinorhynchus agilis]
MFANTVSICAAYADEKVNLPVRVQYSREIQGCRSRRRSSSHHQQHRRRSNQEVLAIAAVAAVAAAAAAVNCQSVTDAGDDIVNAIAETQPQPYLQPPPNRCCRPEENRNRSGSGNRTARRTFRRRIIDVFASSILPTTSTASVEDTQNYRYRYPNQNQSTSQRRRL